MTRTWTWGLLWLLITGCAHQTTATHSSGWQRAAEQQLAGISAQPEVRLRYNPASCGSPAFELRLAGKWVRVAWTGFEEERWATVREELASRRRESGAVTVRVRASGSSHALTRGASRRWQAEVEVSEVIAYKNQ